MEKLKTLKDMGKTEHCGQCGTLCYADGFGDDVIPAGYYTNEDFLCENCYHEEDYDEEGNYIGEEK